MSSEAGSLRRIGVAAANSAAACGSRERRTFGENTLPLVMKHPDRRRQFSPRRNNEDRQRRNQHPVSSAHRRLIKGRRGSNSNALSPRSVSWPYNQYNLQHRRIGAYLKKTRTHRLYQRHRR